MALLSPFILDAVTGADEAKDEESEDELLGRVMLNKGPLGDLLYPLYFKCSIEPAIIQGGLMQTFWEGVGGVCVCGVGMVEVGVGGQS